MVTKSQMSALTASGDTTKTIVDTLQVPQGAKRIIGIWQYGLAAATLTTGESVSGVMEYESSDINLVPLQLPLPMVDILTSGAAAINPFIFPVDIPVHGGERIAGYVTMDMAQTGGLKARFGFIYEF